MIEGKIWSCTNAMCWLNRTTKGKVLVSVLDPKDSVTLPDKTERVLQQWIADDGETEWRDVPIVEE